MIDFKENGRIASSPTATPVAYPEFSEDFSTKYQDSVGLQMKIYHRVSVLSDEIPHFAGGLPLYDTTMRMDVAGALMQVLPEFDFSVDMEDNSVSVGSISVNLPTS